MKIRPALIATVMALYLQVLTSAPQTDFDEANSYYEKGDYENSCRLYEKILSDGYENGKLYYNLGNSYYKTGDIVRAILNYERALKLIPADTDLLENLKTARLSLADKINDETVVPFFTFYNDLRNHLNIYTAKNYFYFSVFAFSIIFSLFILSRSALFKKSFAVLGMISAVISVLTAYTYYDIYTQNSERHGIVADDKISVLSSPDENINSKELFYLHRGTKAKITRSNDQWLEIEIDSEKKGWVRKEAVIEI